MDSPRFWVVIPAAGIGKRMGSEIPKQYLPLLGKPVLQHTIERLLSVEELSGIAVALHPEDRYWPSLPFAEHPNIYCAEGGKERADSVLSGLCSLHTVAREYDWVLVHDAARPCLRKQDVRKLMNTLRENPVGGILALPVSDTLKQVEGSIICNTLDRTHIWRALTPQMFRYGILKQALGEAVLFHYPVTDEASAIEWKGLHPTIIEGFPDNVKITRSEDLTLAAFYLEQQCYE